MQHVVDDFGNSGVEIGRAKGLPGLLGNQRLIGIRSRRELVGIHHRLTDGLAGKGIYGPGSVLFVDAHQAAKQQVEPRVTLGIRFVILGGLDSVEVVQNSER